MTISVRTRAAIVTSNETFKGHYFVMDEYQDGNIATVETPNGEILLTLTDAAYDSRDGVVYRVTGKDADGNDAIWRAVRACARCSSPARYATPAFDVPT